MRTTKSMRRLMAVALAIVMTMALAIPAFAAETEPEGTDTGPDLEAIAAMYADWDGSYELPDLSELSKEDQEAVKAMVDAIMLAREAEAQAETQTETPVETQIDDEVPATVSFSDVPTSHTFYAGVMYCAGRGIVNGYADGTFRPGNSVTRANFVVMLARAFYPDELERYSTDSNLKYGYATPAFVALNYKGLLAGTNFDSTAKFTSSSVVNQGISRYDMARLMTNIMKAKGFAASNAQKSAAQAKITDYKNIPSAYQDSVKNVYALGIIGGYGDGRFIGTNVMNRGQAAIVIQRMAQYAPVKGDQDNDTYDDGKEKPGASNPGTNSGSTGSNTGSSTGSNTGSTGSTGAGSNTGSSGTTGTTEKPDTNKKTLADGSAITEANVMRLMEARVAQWGSKTWGNYNLGNSGDVGKTVRTYVADGYTSARVSCTSGCGGWATYISDAAFGNTGFPMRKTTPDNIRAGDIVINLLDGKITHVSVASGKNNVNDFGTYTVTNHGVYTANANTVPGHSPNKIDPTSPAMSTNYNSNTGYSVIIYTRYPD